VHYKVCLNAPHAWQVEELGAAVTLCGSVGRLLCLGALLHHTHHRSSEPHQCKALLHPASVCLSVCLSVGLIVRQQLRLYVCLSVHYFLCLCVCLLVCFFVFLSLPMKSRLPPLCLHPCLSTHQTLSLHAPNPISPCTKPYLSMHQTLFLRALNPISLCTKPFRP